MNLKRREFLLQSLIATLTPIGTVYAGPEIKIGLTPVILDDQLGFLRNWKNWLENQISYPVRFVQRQKYQDISELLLAEQIDAAWICGYPYVRYRPYMKLLAVPRYKGRLTYHSYIIVHKKLEKVRKLEQLRDKVFTFSDPDSNSGYLYPNYRFLKLGITPHLFFKRTFFTWAHRNTIDAVASGLADAGAVDSYVWDQYRRHHPEMVKNTRIIEQSPAYGFPPFVVRNTLPSSRIQQLAKVLLNMDSNLQGKQLLHRLGLEGFEPGSDALFAGIEKMMQQVTRKQSGVTASDEAS